MQATRWSRDSFSTCVFATALGALALGCGGPPEGATRPRSAEDHGQAPQPRRDTAQLPSGIKNIGRVLGGFVFPQKAKAARIQGLIRIKCVITTEGWLRKCQVIKSLPYLDEVVLARLEAVYVGPAMFQGRPINWEFTISLRFELDETSPASSSASPPSAASPPASSSEDSSTTARPASSATP
jgi:TonB family protein